MSKPPAEPPNIVLEQLRLMRAENQAFRSEINAKVDKGFSEAREEISALKKDVRGLKMQTIGEVYKANLTVASFVDLSQRLEAVERKVFP